MLKIIIRFTNMNIWVGTLANKHLYCMTVLSETLHLHKIVLTSIKGLNNFITTHFNSNIMNGAL